MGRRVEEELDKKDGAAEGQGEDEAEEDEEKRRGCGGSSQQLRRQKPTTAVATKKRTRGARRYVYIYSRAEDGSPAAASLKPWCRERHGVVVSRRSGRPRRRLDKR